MPHAVIIINKPKMTILPLEYICKCYNSPLLLEFCPWNSFRTTWDICLACLAPSLR